MSKDTLVTIDTISADLVGWCPGCGAMCASSEATERDETERHYERNAKCRETIDTWGWDTQPPEQVL